MADGQVITLRLTIADPVPGVAYSLQDKASAPIDAQVAKDGPISFNVPVKLADGSRFLGPFVRSEGPQRRFVYIAIGRLAGDAATDLARRAKVDIHDIPTDLLAQAQAGRVLQVTLPGRDKHGLPACASVRPLSGWKAV